MTVAIRLAELEDAPLVHQTMLAAFEQYRNIEVPSSALNETVESIKNSIAGGTEKAIICFCEGVPVGSARFKMEEKRLYFARLSVCPEARGKGIAKLMIAWLENYAKEHGKSTMWCRVRMSIPQNIQLYRSVGYDVAKEEVVTNPNGFQVKIVVMEKEINCQDGRRARQKKCGSNRAKGEQPE